MFLLYCTLFLPFKGSGFITERYSTAQVLRPQPGKHLGRMHMEHSHGYEYQVKIVHEDGTEQLSGWNSEAQVAQAMAATRRPQGTAYWLRERNVVCPNCPDREQKILEYPFADIPSQRYSPHDSRYLLVVGYKNRYELREDWWYRTEVEQPASRAFKTAA
jgi:hypothetical protein